MRFIIFIITSILFIIIFIPKDNLFFTFQKLLKEKNIYINFKDIYSDPFKLRARNIKIYYKSIESLNINSMEIMPLLFYNKLNLKNIQITLNNKLINNVEISYTILNPLKIIIKGDANGFIDLKNRFIKVYFSSKIVPFLKYTNKGYYYYADF